MANQPYESFNRRFALFLLTAVLAAVGLGFWFERQTILHLGAKSKLPKHESDYHPWGPVPAVPQWVKDVPLLPDWWAEIVVTNYDAALSAHDRFARMEEMKKVIRQKVIRGISPVHERRELIKYISLLANSSTISHFDRAVVYDTARIYEELGDYKRAAKIYADDVEKSAGEGDFYGLAFQYERAGDNKAALQIYNFMIDSFRNGSIDHWLGKVGKARLGVVTNDCVLRKPEWWGQYEGQPEWWAYVTVDLPKVSCMADGITFVIHKWGNEDPRRAVKALTALLDLKGITFSEREMATSLIGNEYSAAGDHYRAIETRWKIPGHLACYPFECTNQLGAIAREFEKLGETNHAKEIRDAISCFSKWPRDIVRK